MDSVRAAEFFRLSVLLGRQPSADEVTESLLQREDEVEVADNIITHGLLLGVQHAVENGVAPDNPQVVSDSIALVEHNLQAEGINPAVAIDGFLNDVVAQAESKTE
jgi:hypothetical protein